MPLNGSGVASKPAGTTAVANTTVESAKFNSVIDDIYAILNLPRPITAGGTGATSASAARTALAVPGTATVNTFTATQTWSKGADVASATALTLGDDGNYFDITGTTTVTSIATKGAGTVVKLHFDAALTLTHHSTDLVLPGGLNITTAAGDEAEFVEYATGDWRCTNYTRNANLSPVAFVANKAGTDQTISPSTPTKVLFANTDRNTGAYNAVNSRFTPPAGDYVVTAKLFFSSGLVAGEDYQLIIYKNGASVANIINRAVNTSGHSITISEVVNANGTDYFEIYAQAGGTGSKVIFGDNKFTNFAAGSLK